MIKAILFDVDGTLLDTEKIYMQAWRDAGAMFGYQVTQAALMRTRAVSVAVAKQAFREEVSEDFPYDKVRVERIRIAEQLIAASDAAELRKPGVTETLHRLKEHGFPMAVASSTGYAATVEHLQHAELWHFFDAAVGGDMIRKGKPEPDIFLKAAELLGVQPAECLVVGDTPADVFAGSAAGMQVILIPDQVPANEQTTALSWKVLDTISQLPRVLKEEAQ